MQTLCGLACLSLIVGCGGGGSTAPVDSPQAIPAQAEAELSAVAAIGELLFHDAGLSASGQVACDSCHAETAAHAQPQQPNPATAVPLGGTTANTQGFRNAPSLRYLRFNPAFYFDNDGVPTGGLNRDGRADTLAAQARRPFLAPHEMANGAIGDVVAKLQSASYVNRFTAVFGSAVFDDPAVAFERMLLALQRYQLEAREFAPFDSKFDYFLAGKARLSAPELRGLALYNNPAKGNCAACHPSTRAPDGTPPLFTDFTYDTLGVPRNLDIAANADPDYFDLGLCGPDRTDLADRPALCGAFKVPSLRNVALTAPYFHNGRFQSLREVLGFYVRRDTNPEEWYPEGGARLFDDLPVQHLRNVNRSEPPYDRGPGDLPALADREIDDVIAFLNTLTDGYLQ